MNATPVVTRYTVYVQEAPKKSRNFYRDEQGKVCYYYELNFTKLPFTVDAFTPETALEAAKEMCSLIKIPNSHALAVEPTHTLN